jgi:tRNA-modifying protein YgfZ
MNTPFTADGSVPLIHWGLMRARGADATQFLQGQLTNDLLGMPEGSARLAGFCSAKGRLQASFIVWKLAPDELLLACSASVLPATLKRLSMFVMRAQCKLSDASAELTLHGAVGAAASGLVGDRGEWCTRAVEGGTLVRLPDVDGIARCMLALDPNATPPQPSTLSLDAWRWLEVRSGLPLIEAATAEQFVPQMLNYELVGGVDFQKGCYPGQEIVARSQYRGTIKRRMFFFTCDAPALAGQEVFHSAEAEQPAGMVVNAAPRPGDVGSALLVEVKLAALAGGSLHLGSPAGPGLHLGQLPYPVPLEPLTPA